MRKPASTSCRFGITTRTAPSPSTSCTPSSGKTESFKRRFLKSGIRRFRWKSPGGSCAKWGMASRKSNPCPALRPRRTLRTWIGTGSSRRSSRSFLIDMEANHFEFLPIGVNRGSQNDGDRCVGLAVLQPGLFKYMYLSDLKVSREYRGRHIGRRLMQKSKEMAVQNGYCRLYTQGQDDNPGACLFYLNCGFYTGGLDTNVYRHTKQEGKADTMNF